MIFLVSLQPLLNGNNPVDINNFISQGVFEAESELAQRFQQGRPFRHVVIDDFLTAQFCSEICEQFPEFHDSHAINENEQVGGKATREEVRALGDAYRKADDLMRAPEFLALIGRITGVADLHYDPYYFGGGTHENREGQELDPHIDFNYHTVSNQHRRLNLIIYLNSEWEASWGGSLQLHRDPYLEPSEDEILTLTPLMNRCVIFETNEHSWHGFERISLPDDKKGMSRKSFAVYFYTDLRPSEELADEHSTVYVERHLPDRFSAGMVLDEAGIQEIKRLLARRDQHLKRLYGKIQRLSGQLSRIRRGSAAAYLAEDDEKVDDLRSAIHIISFLRQRIHDLEYSTSWRLTAPVRAVKRLVSGKS